MAIRLHPCEPRHVERVAKKLAKALMRVSHEWRLTPSEQVSGSFSALRGLLNAVLLQTSDEGYETTRLAMVAATRNLLVELEGAAKTQGVH